MLVPQVRTALKEGLQGLLIPSENGNQTYLSQNRNQVYIKEAERDRRKYTEEQGCRASEEINDILTQNF